MDIPKIGGARGVFEIFVPGLFLWFNGLLIVYSLPWTPPAAKAWIAIGAGKGVAAGIAVSVVYGYLLGLLLRLFRCEYLDSLSAWWLRLTDRRNLRCGAVGRCGWWFRLPCRLIGTRKALYKNSVSEKFPYIGWIHELLSGKVVDGVALEVWRKYWRRSRPANPHVEKNQQFYNFRKLLVVAQGGSRAEEIYAAESLTRYMAGMGLALLVAVLGFAATAGVRYRDNLPWVAWAALAGAYAIAWFLIVSNFRLIRLKEVETVFAGDVSMYLSTQSPGLQPNRSSNPT